MTVLDLSDTMEYPQSLFNTDAVKVDQKLYFWRKRGTSESGRDFRKLAGF
jgi:hypothetical protein